MQEDPLAKLKEELVRIYLDTDDDVVSVSYGCKNVAGTYLEEKCIRFGVLEKKHESQLLPEKIIPKTITIDGVVYKTDVYERKDSLHTRVAGIQEIEAKCSAYVLVTQQLSPNVYDSVHIPKLYGLCGKRTGSFESTELLGYGDTFCFDNDAPQSQFSGANYHWQLVNPNVTGTTQCAVEMQCCNECNSVPITDHRQKIRPLIGGTSVLGRFSFNSSGTLGGIVIDELDGKMVGITNAHVSGAPGYLNTSVPGKAEDLPLMRADQSASYDIVGIKDGKDYGAYYPHYDYIQNTQPSNGDSNITFNQPDVIGTTKRVYPQLVPHTIYDLNTNFNEIDCALINLSDSIVSTGSWQQKNLDSLTSPPPFATTAEIDAITTSTPIMESGRTSGARGDGIYNQLTKNNPNSYSSNEIVPIGVSSNAGYPLYTTNNPIKSRSDTDCAVRVTDTSTIAEVNVTVDTNTNKKIKLLYKNIIRIEPKYPSNIRTGDGGDSGSLILAYINNTWKIIGLHFAGSPQSTSACRIDRIADLMNIKPYLGTTVDANPNSIKTRVASFDTHKDKEYIKFGNKKYWLIGRNFLSPNDVHAP